MSKLTLDEFKTCYDYNDPVAWFVFYKDDGQLAHVVYTREEAAKYAKMAYDVYSVRAGFKQ